MGILKGRVLVEWDRQDKFIFRKDGKNTFSFKPSFMKTAIVPEDMFTDGGSVPQIFWGIPGLSPWGLGPAYIIHDWIFEVHRCGRPAPPEVAQITFEQSAQILAEVGKALVEANLIQDNMLEPVVWAVRTRYARDIWDRPGTEEECRPPSDAATFRRRGVPSATVVDFTIAAQRR
jgi:hypothetical protein